MPHADRNCSLFRSIRVHPYFSGVRVVRSLAICVVFCRPLFVCYVVLFRLAFVLSVLLRYTASDYPFGIFWSPLWYLLITPLLSSDYPFGIFRLPLWYLPITPLLSSDYPFVIFRLPLWYLLITPLVSSDYPFGIFKLFLPILFSPLYFLAVKPFKIIWLSNLSTLSVAADEGHSRHVSCVLS